MRIFEENGEMVVKPDGISDKWTFFEVPIFGSYARVPEWNDILPPNDKAIDMEDELANEGYRCSDSIIKYIDEIRSVYLLMPENVQLEFLNLISAFVKTIKENTNRPAHTKKEMYEKGVRVEEISDWGIIIKLLATQVIYEWVSDFNIAEEEGGYYEYLSVLSWVELSLKYCICQFWIFRSVNTNEETDLFLTLIALCKYLYETKLGYEEQCRLKSACGIGTPNAGEGEHKDAERGKNTDIDRDENTPSRTIPKELDNDRFKALLRRLIDKGYCKIEDGKYMWVADKWDNGRSRTALTCLAYKVSSDFRLNTKECGDGEIFTNWSIIEEMFDYTGKVEGKNQLKQCRDNWKKSVRKKEGDNGRTPFFNPPEINVIDGLFEGLPEIA